MAKKKDVLAKAELLNVDVDVLTWSGEYSYDLQTPAGFMFNSTDCHAACGSSDSMAELWRGISEDLNTVVECTVRPCDYCERG